MTEKKHLSQCSQYPQPPPLSVTVVINENRKYTIDVQSIEKENKNNSYLHQLIIKNTTTLL